MWMVIPQHQTTSGGTMQTSAGAVFVLRRRANSQTSPCRVFPFMIYSSVGISKHDVDLFTYSDYLILF